jgi:uncharacterized membrane protein YidH (DUF202 family)
LKNPDSYVNYHLSKPFTVDETVRINDINFHIPILIKEVKLLPQGKIKQYRKTIQTFLVTASSFTMLPLRSMANSVIPTQTVSTLPQSATGIPPELLELLLMILKISVGAAVILAAILLVMNAIGKMFRIKGMTEWAVDIVKALVQVLVAVPIVFLIYYVANLLFSKSGWFVSPF